MGVEENKSIVTRALELGLVARDPDAAKELFADDFVGHGPAEDAQGPDGAAAEFQTYLDAFEQIDLDIQKVEAEGERVVAHFEAHGLQTGPLQHIPATGRVVHIDGVVVNTVKDGRISEAWWTLQFR